MTKTIYHRQMTHNQVLGFLPNLILVQGHSVLAYSINLVICKYLCMYLKQ